MKYMGKSNVMEDILYNNNLKDSRLRKLMLLENFDESMKYVYLNIARKNEIMNLHKQHD